MMPAKERKLLASVQAQTSQAQPKPAQRRIPPSSSTSSSRPQTSRSAVPPRPLTSSRPLPPLPAGATSSTSASATRPLSAATNMRRERQARLTQTNISSSQTSPATWTAPGVSSRPSVRSNASTGATSDSSSVLSTNTSHSSNNGNNVCPPPGPLSSRPPLQLASFAQRVANGQFDPSPNLPPPITAPADLLSKEQVLPPRRFHIDGQTYDDPLAASQRQQAEEQRPSSSDSTNRRIGPWTANETGHHTDGENEIDLHQYVSVVYQPRPQRACLSLDCNGDCRECTPIMLSYRVPEQQKPKEKETQKQQQQQQQRRQQPVVRPPPPPQQQHPVTRPPQQRKSRRQSSQARQPKLWVPHISSPLRQAHPSSPYETLPPSPEIQRPSSPRPNSENISPMSVSPLDPPSQSPLRDETMSPVSFIMPFSSSDPKHVTETASSNTSHTTAYETDDPAITKALCEAEKENGEPLLPWDVETIKASMERRPKAKRRVQQPQQPQQPINKPKVKTMPFVAWHKDPDANRAASESSTTALAFLLKTLSSMPQDAQQSIGIVGIGSVGQKHPQPSPPATATLFDAIEFPSAQRAAIYEDDGFGDYTDSWPEGSYYFGNMDPVPEQPRHIIRQTLSKTSRYDQLSRPSQAQQSVESRKARHPHQR
ncbi:hypothetical protein SBRCBS47491_008208 [Sporothrix bragantina]|uniref:Uncharacterized protein n=1 Tax=Sporothrix bragantina TaxID=671064 RepID=A0ABP0CLJ1_9PEZI